ncbi:hypothetical protein BASA83_009483 [Batrachochytrium salamandrivorans]|nr:hypothetical protein BASA83_009483 [Batrachochytrium salamandrivorans]
MAETKSGNKYLITCIDYATRWVLAKPVKDIDRVCRCSALPIRLNDDIMELPFEIISDRGKSFLAEGIRLVRTREQDSTLSNDSVPSAD